MGWLYVPESEDSNLVSNWPWIRLFELCVMSSGKLLQRPFSWPGWQTRSYARRLSGIGSKPSTVNHGAARWIASLPDCPALHFLRPGSAEGSLMSVGSGPTCSESSTKPGLGSSSVRTSQGSETKDSRPSQETLPAEGSMRSGVCSRRKELEPPIAAKDCFSSPWPTPTASDSNSSGAACYSTESGRHSGTTLTDAAVRLWATPKASDPAKAGPNMRGSKGDLPLPAQAFRWQREVSQLWPTPTAQAYGSNRGGAAGRTGPIRMSLEGCSRQIEDQNSGVRSQKCLNPRFVEALMGFPENWTSARTDFDVSATRWSHWLRHMRSALWCLGSK